MLSMKEWGAKLRAGYKGPIAATDIIIEHTHPERGEGVIIITRKFSPKGKAWPGGIGEPGLSLEENAIAESKQETGLDVILHSPEIPLRVFSHPRRDPREQIMSVVYVATGYGVLKEGDDAKTAKHYTRDELQLLREKDFAFPDHYRALQAYLNTLPRQKPHVRYSVPPTQI